MHVRFSAVPELGPDMLAFAVVQGDRTVIVRCADLPIDTRMAVMNSLIEVVEDAIESGAEVAAERVEEPPGATECVTMQIQRRATQALLLAPVAVTALAACAVAPRPGA